MPKARALWSVFIQCVAVCAELEMKRFVSSSLMLVAIPPQLTSFCPSLKHFTQHPGRTEVKKINKIWDYFMVTISQ